MWESLSSSNNCNYKKDLKEINKKSFCKEKNNCNNYVPFIPINGTGPTGPLVQQGQQAQQELLEY